MLFYISSAFMGVVVVAVFSLTEDMKISSVSLFFCWCDSDIVAFTITIIICFLHTFIYSIENINR